MSWPKSSLFEEAADGSQSGGDGNVPNLKDQNKIKIGSTEYDIKEAESAISLFKALQDPETGTEIIETLAKRSGLLDRLGSPKESKTETEKVLESKATKMLKKALGKDYDKFSDTVGPALDEIIQDYIKEKFTETESNRGKDKWESQVDKFMESHSLTEEIEDKMQELMLESPPNVSYKGFDPQKYLSKRYKEACEELEIEPPEVEKSVRRKSRKGDDLPEFVVRDAPKSYTIDDAVDAAMKGIRFRRVND